MEEKDTDRENHSINHMNMISQETVMEQGSLKLRMQMLQEQMITITRDTAELCAKELDGQITDGIFENSATGNVVEIIEGGRELRRK